MVLAQISNFLSFISRHNLSDVILLCESILFQNNKQNGILCLCVLLNKTEHLQPDSKLCESVPQRKNSTCQYHNANILKITMQTWSFFYKLYNNNGCSFWCYKMKPSRSAWICQKGATAKKISHIVWKSLTKATRLLFTRFIHWKNIFLLGLSLSCCIAYN